ncbi:MAG: sensor histidine kinase [Myxococcota bacterium]
MEILALYSSPETLPAALAAGARHLAGILSGFALVYRKGSAADQPDGWAGFACAGDAQSAGISLARFREQVEPAHEALTIDAPEGPPRIWERAEGGIYGFQLRISGPSNGVVLVGCPGEWPRMRKAEVDSILHQLALVLDHCSALSSEAPTEPSEDLLQMSEQIFAQDIELLKKEEELDRVEQLHDDLIEKVSHELRTPMNSILERLVSILSTEHETLAESSREALRGALDDGNGILRTLENLRDLWRLKRGQVSPELQDVHLYDVIDEAIFNVRDRLRPDVILEKRLPVDLVEIRTDLALLSQILFLILDNAVKFTPQGRVSLEATLEEGLLLVDVTDTGIGISAEDRERIFDEFFQVDRDRGGPYRGAGLGLALVRALLERLGGAISVSSEIGRGSRFSFTLPVAHEQPGRRGSPGGGGDPARPAAGPADELSLREPPPGDPA